MISPHRTPGKSGTPTRATFNLKASRVVSSSLRALSGSVASTGGGTCEERQFVRKQEGSEAQEW